MGRRSTFDSKIATAVLREISRGANVQVACDRAGVKRSTWIGWSRKLSALKAARDARTERIESPPVPTPRPQAIEQPEVQRTEIQPPPTPRAQEIEQPEVVGTCTWRANPAAVVAIVEMCGAFFDQLRIELRRAESAEASTSSALERKGVFDGR